MLGGRTGWARGLVACGVVVAVAACGAEALNGGAGGFEPSDGGTQDVTAPDGASDAGVEAAAVDSGAGEVGGSLPTTALLVQASPSLPDVRLCWSVAGAVQMVAPFPGSGAMPGSNYPGIPLGGGAPLSDVSELSAGSILYAIDAENLARLEQGGGPWTCDQLICPPQTNPSPPCLRTNTDYWALAPLTSGLTPGTSVVALTGCLASAVDPLASAARCGPPWTAVSGNLHAEVVRLTAAAPDDAGQLVAQAALLSPALAQLLGDAGAAVVSFGTVDGGVPLTTLSTEDDLGPSVPATLQLAGGLPGFGALGFSVDVPSLEGGAGHEWMSLVQAQQLVDPTQDPTVFFGQPRTYLVAVVGDPNATHAFVSGGDAGYDGTGLHLLVLASPAPPSGDP